MNPVRRELDKVTSPLIELRHQRLALARQTSKMREQALTPCKGTALGGYGLAHGSRWNASPAANDARQHRAEP
jgi:hypothetical protein